MGTREGRAKAPPRYGIVERQKRRLVLPFLMPALAVYGGFMLYPAFTTFYVAVTDWNGITADLPFVGLGNFTELWSDETFRGTIGHTIWFTVLGALVLFPAAIFFAFVTHGIAMSKMYRFLIIAPMALSVTTAALLWKFALNPGFGLVAKGASAIGVSDTSRFEFLGNPRTAMVVVVLATVWHGIGLWMTLFAAAIDRVPVELREAARLDGASELQVLTRIVWPLIWDVTRTLLILWIIQGLQAFAFIVAITNGGPLGATEVIGTYLYRVAFGDGRFGYGAAIAVVLFFAVLLLASTANRLTRRESEQY